MIPAVDRRSRRDRADDRISPGRRAVAKLESLRTWLSW